MRVQPDVLHECAINLTGIFLKDVAISKEPNILRSYTGQQILSHYELFNIYKGTGSSKKVYFPKLFFRLTLFIMDLWHDGSLPNFQSGKSA